MNREVLINSLEEFMSETDARLTDLEAAKPKDADQQARELIAEIHRLEMDAYQAEGDLAELEAENAKLARQRDNLEFALGTAADKIRRLTEGFYALEEQRNALAAQVDDLRNINAGLRKDNERLAAEVERLAYDNANLKAGKSYWLNGSGTLLRRLNALEEQRNALAAQVDDLTRRHENAWYAFDVAVIQNDRKEHELMEERAERNALAAQVDDLRNINAGLRKDNERLTIALEVWMR